VRLLNIAFWIAAALASTSLGAASQDTPFAARVVSMQYSRLAAMAVITGSAVLRVQVDTAGNVVNARGLSGHPILIKAAVTNIKLWKFLTERPVTERNGLQFDFTYVFELKGTSQAPVQCSTVTYEYPNTVTILSEAPYVMESK
jgi:TonB family protein